MKITQWTLDDHGYTENAHNAYTRDQDWEEVPVEVIRDIIRDQDQNIDLGLKAVKCHYIEGFQKEDFQIFYLKKNSR